MSYETDLEDSSFDFERVVWPIVGPGMGGGRVTRVEGQHDPHARFADIFTGADFLQHLPNGGIRTIASRVQWERAWRTFTIRRSRDSGAETELSKRLRAHLDQTLATPGSHVQAYVSKARTGHLRCAASISTRHLLEFVHSHLARLFADARRTVNASFIWIEWDELREAGTDIAVFDGPAMADTAPVLQLMDERTLRWLADREERPYAKRELQRRGLSQ